jgi:hypothetical protein
MLKSFWPEKTGDRSCFFKHVSSLVVSFPWDLPGLTSTKCFKGIIDKFS